ncbi:MAG: hypothetical protein U9P68_15465 [Pseudomonadota bacterium]|nr:hypothetical protein [Pseudomonadota bacterium]
MSEPAKANDRRTQHVAYGTVATVLVGLLALYSAIWSGLVLLAWLGLTPDRVFHLDIADALALLPVWTRLALWLWTALLLAALAAVLFRRKGAAVLVAGAIIPHLAVFLTLSANPYYDGTFGYLNITLEIFLVYWCARRSVPASR